MAFHSSPPFVVFHKRPSMWIEFNPKKRTLVPTSHPVPLSAKMIFASRTFLKAPLISSHVFPPSVVFRRELIPASQPIFGSIRTDDRRSIAESMTEVIHATPPSDVLATTFPPDANPFS